MINRADATIPTPKEIRTRRVSKTIIIANNGGISDQIDSANVNTLLHGAIAKNSRLTYYNVKDQRWQG